MSIPQPAGTYPVWVISEEARKRAIQNKVPFGNYQTMIYYQIIGRVDSHYLEIILGHNESMEHFHTDVRETRFTYIGEFQKREKIYLTFDRVTLYQLVEMYPASPKPIRFMVKRVETSSFVTPNRAFMIMPFRDDTDYFYKHAIKPYLKEKHDIDIFRADDFRDNDVIIETIYRQIEECEFVIADTTNENKNAFYELGYAAAFKKEIITIQHLEAKNLFFDRSHIRTIFYEPEKIDKFQFILSATIESIRSRQ